MGKSRFEQIGFIDNWNLNGLPHDVINPYSRQVVARKHLVPEAEPEEEDEMEEDGEEGSMHPYLHLGLNPSSIKCVHTTTIPTHFPKYGALPIMGPGSPPL